MVEGGARDSLDYMLECGVCSEDFTVDGIHVPRILPCSHTLCDKCIIDILRRNTEDCNTLECPICKNHHPAQNKSQSFPQNQFILPLIRRKGDRNDQEGRCEKHDRVLSLYCNDPECRKPICQLCMLEEHREHNFVDLPQLQRTRRRVLLSNIEALKGNLQTVKEDLQENKEKLLKKRLELNDNLQASKTQIVQQKEAKIAKLTQIVTGIYEKMLESLTAQKTKELESIDIDIVSIERHCTEVGRIEDQVDLADIPREREKLKNILTTLKQQSGNRHYTKMACLTNAAVSGEIKKSCDSLREESIPVKLFDTLDSRIFASAIQLKGKGEHFF